MNKKVLFIDDEENILHAYKLALRKSLKVSTAVGGEAGLEKLVNDGPFAVVISDLKMPGMDGIEVLSKAKDIAPDTVRVMLTGFADMNTAIDAVNNGNIFRFLTKPCPAEEIEKILITCLRQHQLQTAEKELLGKTLRGSVKVLTEILSLVNPGTFGRAERIKQTMMHMVNQLGLQNAWQYEMAAMLSQVGCITLTGDVLEKIYSGQTLDEEEANQYGQHPEIGSRLIEHIPRLDVIAAMVRGQAQTYKEYGEPVELSELAPEHLGSQLLKIALDFDRQVTGGRPMDAAITDIKTRKRTYNPELAVALQGMEDLISDMTVQQVMVNGLVLNMIIDDNVKGCNGVMLVSKGQTVTQPVLERLKQISEGSIGVEEPIRVLVPKMDSTLQPA
jgi:response regulator RpfG family c-di-GMP phosphodiesterase